MNCSLVEVQLDFGTPIATFRVGPQTRYSERRLLMASKKASKALGKGLRKGTKTEPRKPLVAVKTISW